MEWFNDSNFWEQFAPIMFDDAHWAEVSSVADGITSLSRINLYPEFTSSSLQFSGKSGNHTCCSSKPSVLDMCCGFGRISAELARRGFYVTGVDITESYLKTAREEASLDNLNIEYINADARDFIRPDFFDIAVSLYISLGYFSDQKDDLLLVSNVFKSLKKGGSFIVETLGKEIAVRDWTEGEWFERAGWTVLTQYETMDSWSLLKNRWILIKDGKRIEKTFTQRLYSASELRSLLLEAGFSNVEICGDWDESEYNHRASKLIAIGRKL